MPLPYQDDPYIGEVERAKRRKLAPRGTGTGEPGIEEGNPLTAPYAAGNRVSQVVQGVGSLARGVQAAGNALAAPPTPYVPPQDNTPGPGVAAIPGIIPAAQATNRVAEAIRQPFGGDPAQTRMAPGYGISPEAQAVIAQRPGVAPPVAAPAPPPTPPAPIVAPTGPSIAAPFAYNPQPAPAAPPPAPAVRRASGQITPAAGPVAYSGATNAPPPAPAPIAAPAAAPDFTDPVVAAMNYAGEPVGPPGQPFFGEGGKLQAWANRASNVPTIGQAPSVISTATAATPAGQYGMNDRGAGTVPPVKPAGDGFGPSQSVPVPPPRPTGIAAGDTMPAPMVGAPPNALGALQESALSPVGNEPWRADYNRMMAEKKGGEAQQAQFFNDEAERNRRIAAAPGYRELEMAKREDQIARMSGLGRNTAAAHLSSLQKAYSDAQAPESKRNLVAEKLGIGTAADTRAGAAQAQAQAQRMNPLAVLKGLQDLTGARTTEEAARQKIESDRITLGFQKELADAKTTPERRAQILEQMHAIAGKDNYAIQALGGGVDPETGYLRPQDYAVINKLTGQETRRGGAGAGKPPQAAIDMLKKDPKLREQFEAKYGKGSAGQYVK